MIWKRLSRSETFVAIIALTPTFLGCGSDEETVNSITPIIPVLYPNHDDRPRWSPDGAQILYFHSGITGTDQYTFQVDPTVRGLWSVDMMGKTSFLLRAVNIHGEVSHAGDRIAISAGGNIYIAALAAGGIDSLSVYVLTSGGSDHFPTWSPGDSLIAYESNADSQGYRVHVVDLTGVEASALPFPSREPSWFPDGEQIAFSWTPARLSEEVGRYDVRTSTHVRLTNNGLIRDHWPSVSPTGNQVLYTRIEQRPAEIWLMNADGSNAHFVTKGAQATWAPDGASFAFVYQPDSNIPGLGTLWLSDVNGSRPEQLTGPYAPVP